MFSVHKVVVIAFVVLISILVSLTGMELLLRLLTPHSYQLRLLTQPSHSLQDPRNAKTTAQLRNIVPGFFQPGQLVNGFVTNSEGFVTPEVEVPKNPDSFRVVLIGDSFGVGVVPYPKQFIRLTEEALKEQTRQQIEVINLSVPGIGMLEYERLYSLEALKYQPDLVIISFFVGNDFFVENFNEGTQSSDQSVNPVATLVERSKIFLLVKNQLTLYKRGGTQAALSQPAKPGQALGTYTGDGMQNYQPTLPTLSKETYYSQQVWKLDYFEKGNQNYNDSMNTVLNSVRTLSESSTKAGIPVFFVILPAELQLYEELFVKTATSPPQHPNYDMVAPQRKLTTQLDSLGILYLDLLPILATQSAQTNLYIPQDTHLNEAGNEAVSKALTPVLRDLIQ